MTGDKTIVDVRVTDLGAPSAHFDISIRGRWSSRGFDELIKHLQVYRDWAAEDEAEARLAQATEPGPEPTP